MMVSYQWGMGIMGGYWTLRSLALGSTRLSLVMAVAATAVGHPSRAQTTDDQSAARSGTGISEVVITAEKRASTVQATPISITAISGDQLAAEGTVDLESVARETPGISIRSAGPGQTELEMRGLSSSGGSAPTVGYYLNEVPLSPPASALNGKVVLDPDLFDLDRVEVLRGPQGTLYGSGSMGGTVKLITNAPELNKFSGTFQGTFSGTEGGAVNPGASLMVNLPIVDDKVALRVAITEKFTSGWINRDTVPTFPLPTGNSCGYFGYGCVRGNVPAAGVTTVHKDVNWEDLSGARADLLVKPNSDLSVDSMVMYQRIKMGGYSEYDSPYGNFNTHYQPFDIGEPFSDEFKLVSNTIKYDFKSVQVTLASAYWSREEKQTADDSEQIENLTGLTSFTPITYTESDTSKQLSEELRLTSTDASPLQWVLGGFYSGLSSLFINYNQNPALAYISTGGASANPGGIIYDADNPYKLDQFAVFGEASYQITPSIKATAGLRWFKYNSSIDYFYNGWGSPSGNAEASVGHVFSTANGFTPRFNLSYEPTSDLTVYGTASKGFRPGGISLPAPVSLCGNQPATYGPDSVWDYEIGEKTKLLGDRLTVNSDVYYINWSNSQQLISPPCSYPYTTNAGTAVSYGPELEIAATLLPGLRVSANGTWTSATITDPAPGTINIVKGMPILDIPKYTGNLSATYSTELRDDLLLTAHVADNYVGPIYDTSYSTTRLPAYDLVDVRVGLVSGDRSGYFFINNLTNKHAALTINNTSFSWVIPSNTRVTTNQPRTFGIDFTQHF